MSARMVALLSKCQGAFARWAARRTLHRSAIVIGACDELGRSTGQTVMSNARSPSQTGIGEADQGRVDVVDTAEVGVDLGLRAVAREHRLEPAHAALTLVPQAVQGQLEHGAGALSIVGHDTVRVDD